MNMKTVLVLLALLTMAATARGEIYTWTDADGNVHFGTQPPPEVIEGARDTGIRSQGGSAASLEGVLPGSEWLARQGNRLIKVEFRSNGRSFSWQESALALDGSRGRAKKHYGDYRIEGERLILTRVNKNRERLDEETFLARLSGSDSLKLVDIHVPGRVYRLAAEPSSTRPLRNEREEAIVGTWTQVAYRVEDNIVGYIHFGNGIFYLYDPREHGNRIGGKPSDRDQVASGKWHVEGKTLHLNFWEASGSASGRMLKQERWDIVSVEHRRLEIADNAGRTQVFRRERTR